MNTSSLDQDDIGKLFVGGLSSSTTKESLENYFSQFGEVVDSVVMKNMETGRSRGFGFITFKDPNCVVQVLRIHRHELDGKKIDPKECTPRSMQKTRKQVGKCKVFLGGLSPDITEDAIRSGMSRFGKVDQVVIMYDQETKKCRGFGFLSFELEESIDQACAERFVIINGKQIECKKAEQRVYQKRQTGSFALQKDQNGTVGQSPYGQITSLQQGNWNAIPNQSFLSFQGTTLPSYQTYSNSGVIAFNPSTSAYSSMQALPYAQQNYPPNYGTIFGNYSFSPVSANAYTQSYVCNSQVSDDKGSNNITSETGNICAPNDYSQSTSSYGPSKGTYVSESAADISFNPQNAVPSRNHHRYHPFKF